MEGKGREGNCCRFRSSNYYVVRTAIPNDPKNEAFDHPPSTSSALQGITIVERFIWYVEGKFGCNGLYVGTTHVDGVAHACGIGTAAGADADNGADTAAAAVLLPTLSAPSA